jgi:hypothetical protein
MADAGLPQGGVSGVFQLAIAPLAAAGGAGPGADGQAPADADGIVQDIQALRR